LEELFTKIEKRIPTKSVATDKVVVQETLELNQLS